MNSAQKKYQVKGLPELERVSATIAANLRADGIVLLHGDLGAGKTTLIQHLGQHLQVKSHMSSPTFNLLNQYRGRLDDKDIEVFHLDLYRLGANDDLLDLNFADLSRFENYLAFVEWPDKVNTPWQNYHTHLYELHLKVIWPDTGTQAHFDPNQLEREITFITRN